MDSDLQKLAALWSQARRIMFVTGAGLSADSGLPTYRGVGGLYEEPTGDMPVEVALSGPMFRKNPALTWHHISQIESACRGAQPNRGHQVIAALQATKDVVVLTQNVDGLHRMAGSTHVIDIHGDIHHLMCTACSWRQTVSDYAEVDIPPRCPDCSAWVRPDVVLFAEMLPGPKVRALEEQLAKGFDVVVSVGTSSLFPYVAAPALMAAAQGLGTVEINPGTTEVSEKVALKLKAPAAEALGAAYDLMVS